MKKFIVLSIVCFVLSGCNPSPQYSPSYDSYGSSSSSSSSSDIDKIVAAQRYIRNNVANYPDTLDFHTYTYSPKINGNTVTLKFSCKNAFGVQETHVMDVTVD